MNDDILQEFTTESLEHLACAEEGFLKLEQGFDQGLINTIFRAIHSIKGAAGFFGFHKMTDLSHAMETVLMRLRDGKMAITAEISDALLQGVDILRNMFDDIENSNEIDVADAVGRVRAFLAEEGAPEAQPEAAAAPEPVASEESTIDAEAEEDEVVLAEEEPVAEASTPAEPPAEEVVAAESAPAEATGEEDTAEEDTAEEDTAEEGSQAAASTVESPAKATPAAPPKGTAPTKDVKKDGANKAASNETIRVQVQLLEKLMNLAGELVLGRNQLVQSMGENQVPGLHTLSQRITELQENVIKTRLQRLASVFSKFPRIVRDLSRKVSKEIDLTLEGEDVELDKTILEAISDPLTHLIRNSIDHGVELPKDRETAGKIRRGRIFLRAYHEAGLVNIDVEDDGRGIDPEKVRNKAVEKGLLTAEAAAAIGDREAVNLIFHPGLSTAEQVTDLSGRGVGMDVVKTNFERQGGTVEVISRLGEGTRVNIKLPLTMAVMPTLIMECEEQKFAVPQVNVVEIVRAKRGGTVPLEEIQGADVIRLRGEILPIVFLAEALQMERKPVGDDQAVSVVVLRSGAWHFGLVVDDLNHTEEVVVKPLSRFVKPAGVYSGATILGDGGVAPILDVAGLAHVSGLSFSQDSEDMEKEMADNLDREGKEKQALLLFGLGGPERFAVPLTLLARVEKVKLEELDRVGDETFLKVGETVLPLIYLNQLPGWNIDLALEEEAYILVPRHVTPAFGIVATKVDDVVETSADLDRSSIDRAGLLGSLRIQGQLTLLLDLFGLGATAFPQGGGVENMGVIGGGRKVLVAEDTPFFRDLLHGYLEDAGFTVDVASDGQSAWNVLEKDCAYDLVLSDLVMPRLDGFGLVEQIRNSENHKKLPVVAITSLSDEETRERALKCGFDGLEVKLDRDRLVHALSNILEGRGVETKELTHA